MDKFEVTDTSFQPPRLVMTKEQLEKVADEAYKRYLESYSPKQQLKGVIIDAFAPYLEQSQEFEEWVEYRKRVREEIARGDFVSREEMGQPPEAQPDLLEQARRLAAALEEHYQLNIKASNKLAEEKAELDRRKSEDTEALALLCELNKTRYPEVFTISSYPLVSGADWWSVYGSRASPIGSGSTPLAAVRAAKAKLERV